MPKFYKQNRNKTLFFACLLVSVTLIALYQKFLCSPNTIEEGISIKEAYDPALSRIQSIQDFDNELKTRLKNDFSDTSKIVNMIDEILRNRFYHGYSEYTFNDNWVAYLASKVYWGIKHPVIADDILKFPMAACSQQGLLFQAMLSKHNISYSTITFSNIDMQHSGHYAVSAFYNNSWHFFDSNQEPLKLKGNPSIETLIQQNQLGKIYKGNLNITTQWLNEKIQNKAIKMEGINQSNGKKMMLLQSFLGFFSKWMWLISVILGSTFFFIKFRSKKPEFNKEYSFKVLEREVVS
jgi:hypothetical protein